MTDCLACDVNSLRVQPPGGTILATDTWVAAHGIPPLVRGYVVLNPRRHLTSIADLEPAEAADFGAVAQRLTAAMRTALRPEKVYLFAFGESLAHVHFHLMPRYEGMPPRGGALIEDVFAGRWQVGEGAAAEAAERIRGALQS